MTGRRRRVLAALALAVTVLAMLALRADAALHEVTVGNYYFEDDAVRDRARLDVQQGDQIRFTVREAAYPPHSANVDELGMLKSLLGALGEISAGCPLVLPAHPRVAPQLAALEVPAGVHVIDPLGYLDFVAVEASARLVLTDSGGVQEETTALGVPCLTLRETTERPITVTGGTNVLVGRDPTRIVTEALRVISEGVPARRPALWDGRAGERIAEVLVDEPRPRR